MWEFRHLFTDLITAKDLWFVKNLYCGKDNKSQTLLCGTVLIFVDNTPLRTLYIFLESCVNCLLA